MTMPPQLPPCGTCGYPAESTGCTQCTGQIVAVDGVSRLQAGNRFFVAELLEGFVSLFQASLLLMTKKEYMGKLGLAVLLNAVLVTTFTLGTGYGFYELIDFCATTWLPDYMWHEVASATVGLLLAILATWFLAPSLIQIGLTPFLDPIANATERMAGGPNMKPVEIGLWRGFVASMNAAAQVLVLQIFILVPILILGLIPFVNMVAIPVGVIISAFLNAVVWFEIPVLRRGYGMRYRRRVLRQNWARALGFGLAFNLGMLVPFFNVLFIGPATAVAVSLLYFRFEKQVPPN